MLNSEWIGAGAVIAFFPLQGFDDLAKRKRAVALRFPVLIQARLLQPFSL